MAGALSLICLFLITVCSLLLFRPPLPSDKITDYKTITTEYSKPEAAEARQKVAVKMARFLESNPQIVQQKPLLSLPHYEPEKMPDAPPQRKVEITFQGSTLQFSSSTDFNQWIYKNVTEDAIGFLRQLHPDEANAEQYIEILKKVSEIDEKDEVISEIKIGFLDIARMMNSNKDGYHQQMTAKAIQNYLDLEKDLALGKKTADEILNRQ